MVVAKRKITVIRKMFVRVMDCDDCDDNEQAAKAMTAVATYGSRMVEKRIKRLDVSARVCVCMCASVRERTLLHLWASD